MPRFGRLGSRAPAEQAQQYLRRIDAMRRSLFARARGSQHRTIERSQRFRAVQRRRMWAAVRVSCLTVVGVYLFDAVASGSKGAIVVGLDAGMVALALAAWWSLGRRARHHPELVAWVMLFGIGGTTLTTGVAVPDLAIQSVGYLLILPGLVALLLPWRTRMHLAWLAAYLPVGAGFLASSTAMNLTADERGDLAAVLVVAVAASLAGHVLLQRVQLRSFAQLERIRALRRQSDAYVVQLTRTHDALRTLETTAQQLEQQALLDPLTGLGNRRAFDADLAAALADRRRSGGPLLALLDVDGLKAWNDAFGHPAGDRALQAVAAALRLSFRAGDQVYRLGGDEFAVLVPSGDLEVLGNRLGHRLEAEMPGFAPVRASIGLASAQPGDTPLDITARADAALYASKWQQVDVDTAPS